MATSATPAPADAPAGEDPGRATDRARVLCYRVLAAASGDPRSAAFRRLRDAGAWPAAEAAFALLAGDPAARPAVLAPGELPHDRLDPAPLRSALAASGEEIEGVFDRVFGLVCPRDCPPYETEFCPQTFSVYRSQQLADVAGFYRAFGVEPSRVRPERHDHLSLELEFMAFLVARELHARDFPGPGAEEHAAVCRDAQRRFVADHVAWWMPAFALALRRRADGIADESGLAAAPGSYLGALGVLLAAFVAAERAILDLPPPTELVAPGADDPGPCDGCPS